MADKDRLRFSLEDDEPEVPSNEEELKRRIAKLGNRLSFVTLLLPCLLALALYVGYQDLVLRTSRTQGIELRSVERIAAGGVGVILYVRRNGRGAEMLARDEQGPASTNPNARLAAFKDYGVGATAAGITWGLPGCMSTLRRASLTQTAGFTASRTCS